MGKKNKSKKGGAAGAGASKKGAAAAGGGKGRSKGGGKGGSGGGGAQKQSNPGRRAARDAEKQEIIQSKQQKRKHGGDSAREETAQRMRVKLVQRQLSRLGEDSSAEERCELLQEIAKLHAEGGRSRMAIETLKEVLNLLPKDPKFVRTTLLCLLMDQARSEEARDLVLGPLFAPLTGESQTVPKGKKARKAAAAAPPAPAKPPPQLEDLEGGARLAAAAGCYSLALLTYLAVCVLNENPREREAGEQRVARRLRRAQELNPYCAEILAFYPAFEEHFPEGMDLPDMEDCSPAERPLREALEYCCRLGQVAVWLDADEGVRRYLQRVFYESEEPEGEDGAKEEKPPFGTLPEPGEDPGAETSLLKRWREARAQALDLWAGEMSEAGEGESSCGGPAGPIEEGAEEEDDPDALSEAEDPSDDEDAALDKAEGRFG
eukprot:TRINITY_DN76948_c0_g1_i1.p1 TRINITY_DN76948_c0_g1~~TRINITY_DN76948_c0_g1_i1.p1  ORF type:complete len:454 (-),score=128.33 TRINITY_DN76948_c0_g1_i1:343-1644(-)